MLEERWPRRRAARGPSRAKKSQQLPIFGTQAAQKKKSPYFEALLEGFSKLGYVDGRDFRLLHRFPNEIPDRFKSLAAELVSLNVDVLMGGSIASTYLRNSTKKIPIVFMFIPDPVGMRLVQSLAKPGGNWTGLSNFGREIAGKRLQLLKELVPGLSRVALLTNPKQETTGVYLDVMGAAADQLGLTLQAFDARSLEEMEPAFDAMVKADMQAVTVVQGGTAFQGAFHHTKIGALTTPSDVCLFERNL